MPHISDLDWTLHTHIWLDLDETLASTVSGMLEYAWSINQLTHITSMEDIKKHDASWLGNNITPEEVMKIWEWYGKKTQNPDDIEPTDWSLEGVRILHNLGKSLSIITARSNHESWKLDRTTRWVRSHFSFLENTDIHFVNHFTADAKPKSHTCSLLGVTLMIDDAMENAHELCLAWISCLLLEKPWNRDVDFEHPLVYRAKDWKEVIDSLKV
jgi:uncharacterized HAD superfamily protein